MTTGSSESGQHDEDHREDLEQMGRIFEELHVLGERYARGEIDRDEFMRVRAELLS